MALVAISCVSGVPPPPARPTSADSAECTLLQVCAHSVSWLLDMAAYLEVQPLQDACCEVGAGCSASLVAWAPRAARLNAFHSGREVLLHVRVCLVMLEPLCGVQD